ncbi:MAG: hypothetical protein ACI4IE_04085 [Eubacterium sp.]
MSETALTAIKSIMQAGIIVCIFASIYFYFKARGKKADALHYVFTFLLGLLYLIPKAVISKKKSTEKVPVANKKMNIISITLFVVYLILIAGTAGMIINGNFASQGNYYDMNGVSYRDINDVPFYTRDGEKLLRGGDDGHINYLVNDSGKKHDLINCYVDEDGYIVLNRNDIEYNEDLDINGNIYCYIDKDGNKYANCTFIYWNADGEILDEAINGISQRNEKLDNLISSAAEKARKTTALQE